MEISGLAEFLCENPVEGIQQKVVLSERLKDFPFTIRPIPNRKYSQIRKDSIIIGKKGVRNFDSAKFHRALALEGTVTPDLKNAEFLKKLGCLLPEDALDKFFLPGELDELSMKIMELSGYKDVDELIEEAKN